MQAQPTTRMTRSPPLGRWYQVEKHYARLGVAEAGFARWRPDRAARLHGAHVFLATFSARRQNGDHGDHGESGSRRAVSDHIATQPVDQARCVEVDWEADHTFGQWLRQQHNPAR
jgi:hypothetical protein